MTVTTDFVAGFIAGEASFTVQTRVRDGKPSISPHFSVILHEKDEDILHALQDFFDCGNIYNHRDDCKNYRVNTMEGLQKITRKLDDCEVWEVSEKYDQYKTWSRMVELYCEEYHTSRENMRQMAELARDELNVGLGKDASSWNEFIEKL